MELVKIKIKDIIPYKNNPRINDDSVDAVKKSIKECEYIAPIIIDEDNIILAGHTRLKALKQLKYKEVECVVKTGLSEEQKRKYRLLDNKTNEIAEWDLELLEQELQDLDFTGFDLDWGIDKLEQNVELKEDEYQEPANLETKVKYGDVWKLGKHRLMCGDSTDALNYKHLTNGARVDLVFTDPPYGMKKEADGVLNDNLNYDDLLQFNKQWIPLTFDVLKDNGSWYCWGIDEPLMDIYSEILKPMIKANEITFRNLITWDKGNGQGQNSEEFRMYPIADEKCLFVQSGVQCLTLNADNYWDKYEPIRKYLYDSRVAMGWDVPTMKRIVGHSDLSRDHWTSKSQFELPTKKVYEKMQQEAENQRKEKSIENDAFRKEYDELRKEYDELRAYFNNTHDNMNNVWHFDRTSQQERELTGGHATPKPIALCSRAIKSSSREGEIVLDVFGGSGSTLIACEQLNRTCYMMELDEHYCDVIIDRWEKFTGLKAILINR